MNVNELPVRMRTKIEIRPCPIDYISEPCWHWTGARIGTGYGNIWVGGGKSALAHRVSYELLTGPIPDGLFLDHLCRNRACCNPQHLEPVTNAENIARGVAARTHCKEGHPLSGDNLKIAGNGNGLRARRCRICRNRYNRIWTAQKRSQS